MRMHVQRTLSRCFAMLRQLCQIRCSIPLTTLQKLVVALVHFGWTVEIACWSTFWPTWRIDCSRSWMQQPDWSIAWGPMTTLLTLSLVCTGCGFCNEFSISWLFWRTKFSVVMHHVTSPWFAGPRWWLAKTTTTPLYQYELPCGTASQAISSRQRNLRGCSSTHLEQAAYWHCHGRFTVNLLLTTNRFFISTIISWHCLLTSSNQWSLLWLCHLGHFKNKWLIDWLIDWFDWFRLVHTHPPQAFMALCPGLTGWASTSRNIHPLTPIWSSTILYQLPPSTTIRIILPVQFTCLTVFLHNFCSCLFGLPLGPPPLHTPYISSPNHLFSSILWLSGLCLGLPRWARPVPEPI